MNWWNFSWIINAETTRADHQPCSGMCRNSQFIVLKLFTNLWDESIEESGIKPVIQDEGKLVNKETE